MSARGRFTPVLALSSGCLFGAGILYAGLLAMTRSPSTALAFSTIALGFFVPIVFVFLIASSRGKAEATQGSSLEKRRTDVLIAVAYTFSSIPYWFSAVSFMNGRIGLGFILLSVYALIAAAPLRSMLRVRIALSLKEHLPEPG